jgi:hypothetical protein
VGLLRDPTGWDQPDRSQTAQPYVPWRTARPAAPVLGRGTLACPSCDVPVVTSAALPIAARLRCPFCRQISPARAFLRLDQPDTELNEVQVTARLRV